MADNRDRLIPKHRTPASGISAPSVEIHDETSEAHDVGDDRDSFRARRGTDGRVLRLEHRVDEQSESIAALRADVGEVKGGVQMLVKLETERAEARRATEARELEKARAMSLAAAEERVALRDASARRAALIRAIVLKVLTPLAIGLGAALAAYKAGGG